jgi:hypothetical protein
MKPKGFDIYLKYVCDCDREHFLTLQESKGSYTIVCDVCNKRHKIIPVESVKVLVNFKKCKTPTRTIEKLEKKPAGLLQNAHRVLKSYGYTLEDLAREKIQAGTPTEFVREFLAKQK